MVSSRIASIADMTIKGETAADIGTDHAGLALYMVAEGITPKMIISDLPAGPFNRACLAVAASSFSDKIEVRQGNGLQVLAPGEVVNVIIAGMGGDTIVDILQYDFNKSSSFQHYVLQPMTKPKVIRRFLAARGWPIIKEELVKEKDRLFVIISASPGEKPYSLTPLEMDIGPFIIKNQKQPVVKDYLLNHLKKYQAIRVGLEQTDNCESELLKAQYEVKIARLGEILNGC